MVELPWPEIQQAAQAGAIVLLPIGTIEEHGPHLKLAADTYQACLWCRLTRQALERKGIRTLIAPPMYWGLSPEVSRFPGTFSVRAGTMQALLYDLHACLQAWGFRYVFSLNAHGDPAHNRALQGAIQAAHDEFGMQAYALVPQGAPVLNEAVVLRIDEVPLSETMRKFSDTHAGALETAIMLAFFPEEVDPQLARTLEPSRTFGPLGYWGDPAGFERIQPAEIQAWSEALVARTAQAIERLLGQG